MHMLDITGKARFLKYPRRKGGSTGEPKVNRYAQPQHLTLPYTTIIKEGGHEMRAKKLHRMLAIIPAIALIVSIISPFALAAETGTATAIPVFPYIIRLYFLSLLTPKKSSDPL